MRGVRFAPAVYGSGPEVRDFRALVADLRTPVQPSFISKFRATFTQLPGLELGSLLSFVILLSSFLSSFVGNTTFPATVLSNRDMPNKVKI
jgi:hypothetical protein